MSNVLSAQEWQDSMTQFATMSDGCKIHYNHRQNEGKPILLLSNSLGTTMDMWSPQIEEFSKHFSLITYDKRGHGQSDVTLGAYSIDRLGRDIIELINYLQIEKLFFCGLSIGGMMAQWLATFHPERILALVMANTSARIAPVSMWQDRIDHVKQNGLASIWPAVLTRWVSDEFVQNQPKQVDFMHDMFSGIDAVGYSGCCAAIRDMDLRNLASLNQLPTLIIAGTQDLATPIEDSKFLLEHFENASLIELNAGHLSNIEQTDLFTQAVLAFFQKFDISST